TLNWQYLYDIAKQIPSKYIIFETDGFERPIKIYGNTQPANWDETYILMPMGKRESETSKTEESVEDKNIEVKKQEESEQDSQQAEETAEETEQYLEEEPEIEYFCSKCAFFETEQCAEEKSSPDDPACEVFQPRPEMIEPEASESEETQICGNCAFFETEECLSQSDPMQKACHRFKPCEEFAAVA
ncbi:MAG: hypothetical protein AB1393_13930, partial [Candidatus Edwardsbacteria bacterium]